MRTVLAEIEEADVQSLILAGYPKHDGGVFLRLEVEGAHGGGEGAEAAVKTAQDSLAEIVARRMICFGQPPDPDTPAAHIAFSAEGLRALRLDDEVIDSFPLPFVEGMARRSAILGDRGDGHPGSWEWGGSRTGPARREEGSGPSSRGAPAALLLVYGRDQTAAEARAAEIRGLLRGWRSTALPTPTRLRARGEQRFREHFGFTDGIGNPQIAGTEPRNARPENQIAAGELLLGYPNESGEFPPSPRVAPGGSRGVVLPGGDFGRNGSFLVVRQLEQDVVGFWKFLLEQTLDPNDPERPQDPEAAIRYAAKMVGRWRNGAPLARWSDHEPPGEREGDDDFLYAGDPQGHGCPIGSHVRRTNPRDSSPKLDPSLSMVNTRKRRLLRRGRTYGAPAESWLDPLELVEKGRDGQRRGVHFLCFCANLVDQFEFVQQTWSNARHFGGLRNDGDPLLSHPDDPLRADATDFTIQREPYNQRIRGLPRFVTVRGGGYFFIPGRRALCYIAGASHPQQDGR